MMKAIRSLLKDERGQGMTEYALIIGVVAILLIGVLIAFRQQIAALFGDITTAVTDPGF